MAFGNEPANWTFGVCETCAKNAGDNIDMVRETVGENCVGMLVCPQCGATKSV
jgi:hypothetical protein